MVGRLGGVLQPWIRDIMTVGQCAVYEQTCDGSVHEVRIAGNIRTGSWRGTSAHMPYQGYMCPLVPLDWRLVKGQGITSSGDV